MESRHPVALAEPFKASGTLDCNIYIGHCQRHVTNILVDRAVVTTDSQRPARFLDYDETHSILADG